MEKVFTKYHEFDSFWEGLNTEIKVEVGQIASSRNLPDKSNICLEMSSVGVHHDYLKRGIAGEMTKLVVQNSKNKGFWMSKAECFNLFSTKTLTKQGGIIEKSIKFEDIESLKGKMGGVHT